MTLKPLYPKALLKFWNNYKSFVAKHTCNDYDSTPDNIEGWRNRLFTNFITYLLPSCLIALIPGVYMSLVNGFVFIAIADMLTVTLIALISLNANIKLQFKKILVIATLYVLSSILMIYLSLLGPGMVYLLTLSVVITITCTSKWAYRTIALNALICTICALIIHFRLLDAKLVHDYSLGVWITVSSNLIFLSFVIVMLVSKAIQVLEKTIAKELLLKNELYQKNFEQNEKNTLLKESEEHYKSLFFQSPSPMWVLDKKTYQFLQVNQSAINNYGYTNEEFLAMNIMDIKLENDKKSFQNYLLENQASKSPLTLVTKHRRKNKEEFYVEVIFNTIPFMGKAATLAISNDITAQINYSKSIKEQNDKLREIAWIQCHKVRSPLASIMGLVQLYKESIPKVPIEIMQGILDAAEQLDHVIKETVTKSNE